jgi:hypothetical protein
MVKKAEEILENIVRLAELLDNEALEQVADLPFVELAKAVSIKQPKTCGYDGHQRVTDRGIPPHPPRS